MRRGQLVAYVSRHKGDATVRLQAQIRNWKRGTYLHPLVLIYCYESRPLKECDPRPFQGSRA